jgi:hypothetical protein
MNDLHNRRHMLHMYTLPPKAALTTRRRTMNQGSLNNHSNLALDEFLCTPRIPDSHNIHTQVGRIDGASRSGGHRTSFRVVAERDIDEDSYEDKCHSSYARSQIH